MDAVRIRGKVIWFSNSKGFGFIGRDGGADVFVHYSAIQCAGYKSLKENDEVDFVIEDAGDGRMQAADVSVLGGAQ